MSISRESLYKYLERTFGLDVSKVDDHTALFSSGLLDSFAVADLLTFLEHTGGYVIEPEEVVMENLDSVDEIVKFTSRKAQYAD